MELRNILTSEKKLGCFVSEFSTQICDILTCNHHIRIMFKLMVSVYVIITLLTTAVGHFKEQLPAS
jgi:hypothetical protein